LALGLGERGKLDEGYRSASVLLTEMELLTKGDFDCKGLLS
jgi:hypothetical protein